MTFFCHSLMKINWNKLSLYLSVPSSLDNPISKSNVKTIEHGVRLIEDSQPIDDLVKQASDFS